jgi:hypothetical protein
MHRKRLLTASDFGQEVVPLCYIHAPHHLIGDVLGHIQIRYAVAKPKEAARFLQAKFQAS